MKLPEPEVVIRVNGLTHTVYPAQTDDALLFTAAQMIELRNSALEDAAKVCEQFTHYGEASGIICVKAIRELKDVKP